MGTVVGGCGAPRCRQPVRRRSRVNPCSPPGVARGRFVGGQQSGLARCKPPPLFMGGASSCSSQERRRGEPWGAAPRPIAPTYLPQPMHAWLVWCWPACAWCVYGDVLAAAAVLLVLGFLSRLMVGLLGVGSLALQWALAQSDAIRVVVMPVSVLVGCARVGRCTTRRVTLPVVFWRRVDAVF